MPDSQFKNGNNLAMQFFGTQFGQPAGAGARVDAGRKQRFVRVNVPNSCNKALVEQQRLNVSAMAFQALQKFSRADRQRVGTTTRQEIGYLGKVFKAPKLADIVENQRPVVQFQNGARVFCALPVPQQLARHAQVDIEYAAIELHENLLALAPDLLNCFARQRSRGRRERAACDATRKNLRMQNHMPRNVGRNGADNSFNLWKFRHAS